MNPLIEKLKADILEEGMDDTKAERLVHLLGFAKRAQADAKAEEETLKDIWWEAYQSHGVSKTVTIAGIKMQCTDAGEPKTERIPGHYEIDVDKLLTDYDPAMLVDTGIATWVPPSTTTKPGRKGGVSVTLPKGA